MPIDRLIDKYTDIQRIWDIYAINVIKTHENCLTIAGLVVGFREAPFLLTTNGSTCSKSLIHTQ